IETSDPGTILLKGVTGSGKTRIYIEAAKRLANDGKSSIILVPEIALTPQLIAEFRHDFSDDQLVLTHSHMTEAQRHAIWQQCLHTKQPLIVIGPRSAVFSPLPDLGLIVIDEAHEPSFKQEQSPRYSAIRTATMLTQYDQATVILGSATPSVTDYYLAQAAKRPIIELTKPAVPGSRTPQVQLVSFQSRQNFSEHRFFSTSLLSAMRRELAAGQQVLLFHNRRGTAPLTVCSSCGWNALCPNCYVPMTLHADRHQLFCHLCAHHQPVPHSCPQCKNPDIIHKGIGTKMIAEELQKMFPKVRSARFDADNSVEETLQANYQALYDGDIQIIIGTQLIAKGLDLPKLRVVGVLQADTGLYLPDYQAEERTFQLLYQVAGRVGRQIDANTDVIVQTYQPNHPVIQFGLAKDYNGFYTYVVSERQKALFPPFTHLLKLTCSYNTEAGAVAASRKLAQKLRADYPQIRILGPTPSFYERLGGKYRWQLLLKSSTRATLQHIAREVPKPWQADLDPHSLL
ncbi:MAG TPA: primosomal protein N', partial [Candidatus Saccharimonadales bacterium]|nr:primosomal protein N' [Candidatus Saccharimonadales bacterium]